jgi:hypothetical protein
MKTGILRTLAAATMLALLFVSYRIGYREGFAARGPVLYSKKDVADISSAAARLTAGTYDPHVVNGNAIPSVKARN